MNKDAWLVIAVFDYVVAIVVAIVGRDRPWRGGIFATLMLGLIFSMLWVYLP